MLFSEGMPQLKLLSPAVRNISPMESIPRIDVFFADGSVDRMILDHHNPLPEAKNWDPSASCTYLGHLESERLESKVAVTGCLGSGNKDEQMYITLLSKRSPNHTTFSIDEDGTVMHIKLESSERSRLYRGLAYGYRWRKVMGDEVINKEKMKAAAALGNITAGTVPFAVEVDIMVGYDKSAKEFGNINAFLAKVITHVQAHYQDSTLNHHILLNVS